MLRLLTAPADPLTDVRPAHPGLLRLCVHGPRGTGDPGLAELRVLLVADVLGRITEIGGPQLLAVLTTSGLSASQLADLDRDASALGIHPPAETISPDDTKRALRGPPDVQVHGSWADPEDRPEGLAITVAPVLWDAGPGVSLQLAAGEQDPLVVRLALLSVPYARPARLNPAVLADAARTLELWRDAVAGWAQAPSRPMPPEFSAQIRDAVEEDLGTPAVVAALHSLSTADGVPTGARFESFAFADRVLGLDLASHIGRH